MMDTSLLIGPEPGCSNSLLDRIPIEIVINIIRFSLLQMEYCHLDIMRRVEELSLVDTYWAKCIDQCPLFWTHITSQASSARYTRWLEKSQNAPLHVECQSDEKFMELILPHTARWQSLVFFSSSPNAWSRLTRPVPQLQELDLHGLPTPNEPLELFQGTAPRLKAVRVYGMLAPWHCNIFRDLRELVIDAFHLDLRMELEDFIQALNSSPFLEVLVIKGLVGSRMDPSPIPEPIALPSLRSFTFHSSSHDVPYYRAVFSLVAAIRIPNCSFVSIECKCTALTLSVFPRGFWTTIVKVLQLTEAVDMILSHTSLSITTRPGVSPHLNVKITSALFADQMVVALLKEAEFSHPLSTKVYLTVESTWEATPILQHLAKPTGSGAKRLPRLQELYLKLPKVDVGLMKALVLEHEELRSVLWSRSSVKEPIEIKQRILDAKPKHRWFRWLK